MHLKYINRLNRGKMDREIDTEREKGRNKKPLKQQQWLKKILNCQGNIRMRGIFE